MALNYIPAPLELEFEEFKNQDEFQREFDKASQIDEDPIGHWIRIAKARGETDEKNTVLITLLAELHKKVDNLTQMLSGEIKQRAKLAHFENIESINYEGFKLARAGLAPGVKYYARLVMPTFPKRDIPLFFTAISSDEGKITLMQEKDTKDWDLYVAARERVMIRNLKEGTHNAH